MKLNNKTIRNYLFYSSGLFLLAIPVFYFVLRSVLQHAVDHSLRVQFHETRERVVGIRSAEELATWARLDNDVTLSPIDTVVPDRIYTIEHYNRRHHGSEPYREMSGTVRAQGHNYRLIISSSLIENEDLLGSILLIQVAVLLVLIAVMLWVNQRMSKKLWQPFYVALRNIKEYEVNKRVTPAFFDSTTDEFNELNKAIENLFSRSHGLYLQQREFTENAAHEMQTPVAIFQSKLELLMQTNPISREQADLINTLDSTTRRLTKLNRSLLLLARIENHQYPDTEQVNVCEACERLIEHMDVLTQEKGITVVFERTAAIFVDANPVLIEVLIGNLFSNAIRHNRRGGQIQLVTLENELVVSNTGDEVPLRADRVFNRFQRQARAEGNQDSTGLGLAIVKNICALYRFRIEYNYSDSWHSFHIHFDPAEVEIPISYRIEY